MSKPWLETWIRIEEGFVEDDGGRGVAHFVYPGRAKEADATLGAAAPEMCRALLQAEWMGDRPVSQYESVTYPCCPTCGGVPTEAGGFRPEPVGFHPDSIGHWHECVIDDALKKAGFETQEQRDAARRELGI